MTPTTPIPLDREHYDMIVGTCRDVKYLCRQFEQLSEDVREIRNEISACPCPAVVELQNDVEALQIETSNLKGKLAILVGVIGTVAGWIGSILPDLFGGR